MNTNGPPLAFSLLGVLFGVGVAWLITGEAGMALVFLILGIVVVTLLHLRRNRGR